MTATSTPRQPTQAEIDEILGNGSGLLKIFLERNVDLRPEWKYYGPKNGWTLKLFRKKRNMCFVGHEPGALAMGFVLGERAYDRLMTADMRPALRKVAEAARKYPEGRGVRLVLRGEQDLEDAQVLLAVKGET